MCELGTAGHCRLKKQLPCNPTFPKQKSHFKITLETSTRYNCPTG